MRLGKYYIEKAKARAGALTHELVLYVFFHGYSMLSPNILSGVLESIKIDKNFIWSLLELQNAIREI